MCLVFGLKYMTIHYEMLRIDDTLPRYRYKEGWSTHSTSKTILVYGFRSKKNRKERETILLLRLLLYNIFSISLDIIFWHEMHLEILPWFRFITAWYLNLFMFIPYLIVDYAVWNEYAYIFRKHNIKFEKYQFSYEICSA